jgi:RNA-directed DNA polymerase
MKRAGNLIEPIADADNLRLAFWKASKGKRGKGEVLRFRTDLDRRLRCLGEELLSGCVSWGPYHTFTIHDPKQRVICAAPFRDRVAHHAIINVLEPHFEAYQIHDSYACRKGKGLDAALARAARLSRRGDWYLKMDVRKYFDSMHHGVLKRLLRRRFKDPLLLNLLESVIDSYTTCRGRGVPIGNLTSQYFANHYLGVLDHYVKETLRLRRYVRYMDDMVVWDSDRGRLRQVRDQVAGFLDESLALELKPVCLNACSRGMTFLGYRLFPNRLGLALRSRRRFRVKMRRYHENYSNGRWTEQETARHVEPLLAFVRRADTRSFRRRILQTIEGLCPEEARTA